MRVIVALEARFVRDPAGGVWSASVSPTFWDRYLAVFTDVLVAARVRPVDAAPAGWHRLDRPEVAFHEIPYYIGPVQFLRQLRNVRRSVADLVGPADAMIMRVPSQVSTMIAGSLRKTGHPYGVEVVGDPWDVFAPGVVNHPLRPFLRRYFVYQMRRQCRAAAALGYVTRGALQRRYPHGPGAFATYYSSVELPPAAFRDRSLGPPNGGSPADDGAARRRLIFVGAVELLYKAPDDLLRAARLVVDGGLELEVDLMGGGRELATLKRLTAELGLGGRVRFHGEVPTGDAVRRLLDATDLFVLPSRTEGLPRAMIEAMARGLPCLGSTAGGIPELLAADDLVPPDDPKALASAIERVLTDPSRMAEMSARNYAKAGEYAAEVLAARRDAMYRSLSAATATHAGSRAAT